MVLCSILLNYIMILKQNSVILIESFFFFRKTFEITSSCFRCIISKCLSCIWFLFWVNNHSPWKNAASNELPASKSYFWSSEFLQLPNIHSQHISIIMTKTNNLSKVIWQYYYNFTAKYCMQQMKHVVPHIPTFTLVQNVTDQL